MPDGWSQPIASSSPTVTRQLPFTQNRQCVAA